MNACQTFILHRHHSSRTSQCWFETFGYAKMISYQFYHYERKDYWQNEGNLETISLLIQIRANNIPSLKLISTMDYVAFSLVVVQCYFGYFVWNYIFDYIMYYCAIISGFHEVSFTFSSWYCICKRTIAHYQRIIIVYVFVIVILIILYTIIIVIKSRI